jgi:hypothetical protein
MASAGEQLTGRVRVFPVRRANLLSFGKVRN